MPPIDVDPARALIERYDRVASDYRALWAPTLRIAGLRLLGAIGQRPARRILDVATGVGALLPDLKETFPSAHIVGVDRSRGMLALAPRNFPVAVMDACRLGVASGSTDVVLLAFVLFHLQEPGEALREAGRILTAEGRVACITWGGDFESPATRIFDACLDEHCERTSDAAGVARDQAVESPSKMEGLLRRAGFTNVRSWEEELTDRYDADQLLLLKTRIGSSRPRFESLQPAARATCLDSARRRMEDLSPDDFISRCHVIYSVAEAWRG